MYSLNENALCCQSWKLPAQDPRYAIPDGVFKSVKNPAAPSNDFASMHVKKHTLKSIHNASTNKKIHILLFEFVVPGLLPSVPSPFIQ